MLFEKNLIKAIKAVLNEQMSLGEDCSHFNVKKSTSSLVHQLFLVKQNSLFIFVINDWFTKLQKIYYENSFHTKSFHVFNASIR